MTVTQPFSTAEHEELLRIARVRPRTEGDLTYIRLRGLSPVVTFVGTLAVTAMVIGFAYPIVAMMLNPQPIPIALSATVAGAVLVLAATLALQRHRRIAAGYDDLIIDDVAKAISLPLSFGRTQPTAVLIEHITDIAPAHETPASDDAFDAHTFGRKRYRKRRIVADDELPQLGHRGQAQFAVVICWRDADGAEVLAPIVRWSELRRANAFAHWLRDRLGRDEERQMGA